MDETRLANGTNWEAMYQEKNTPWDKGEPSPGLADFLETHPELPRGTVLVPGCGAGHDVRLWTEAGFAATGYDIAPSAIQISREKTAAAGLKAEFRLGDFLNDPPYQRFDWIFEHTCYCAIQPSQRESYRQAVLRWLKPEGQYLAVYYLIPDQDGPPFGTDRSEVMKRFAGSFQLKEEWSPRSYPNRTSLELMCWWQQPISPRE